jgi:hypothetical protein
MTAAGLVLGLALVWAAGALLAWRLWPGSPKPAVLLAVLAWPAGLALTSSAYFLWMVVSGGGGAWYPFIELACLALAAVLVWRRRRARAERLALPPRPRLDLGTAAFALVAIVAATSLAETLRWAEAYPWGYWDAWSRINLKARFLHAGGPGWTWIFRGGDVPHPDYPLLLECSVARLAQWTRGFDPLGARVLSVLGWAGCVASLVVLAAHMRSLAVGAAAGLMFLADRADSGWAPMQYADLALATYFTWCAGLLVLAPRGERERWWPLLGFCAASAAWCKNEGLVFAALVLALAAALALREPARARAAARLAAGFLAGGAALLVHELVFAGARSAFWAGGRSIGEDLADPARYATVRDLLLAHLGTAVTGSALVPVAIALLVLPRGNGARRSWLPLGLAAAMALAFLFVMVTTSEDLEWHLGTTIDRLVLQLWPLAALGVVSALRSTG